MAIPHAQPGDVIDVRPLGPALAQARSHALFKSADLEVMRIVLRANQELPPHTVAGEITLQCLEGRIEFSCDAGLRQLAPGEMIHAGRNELHGLRAVEDASLLLTIVLPRGAA